MEGHAQSLEGIGVSKATCLEEDFKYEAKLKFPWRGGGGGGATQKPTNMGVSMAILWNYNVDNNTYLLEPIY